MCREIQRAAAREVPLLSYSGFEHLAGSNSARALHKILIEQKILAKKITCTYLDICYVHNIYRDTTILPLADGINHASQTQAVYPHLTLHCLQNMYSVFLPSLYLRCRRARAIYANNKSNIR